MKYQISCNTGCRCRHKWVIVALCMQMRMYSNPVQTLNFKSVDRIILKIVNPSAYNNYHLRQCLCKASLNKNNFSSCILSTINTVCAIAHLRNANKNSTRLYRNIRDFYILRDCYFLIFCIVSSKCFTCRKGLSLHFSPLEEQWYHTYYGWISILL